jgi:hypothetical protein
VIRVLNPGYEPSAVAVGRSLFRKLLISTERTSHDNEEAFDELLSSIQIIVILNSFRFPKFKYCLQQEHLDTSFCLNEQDWADVLRQVFIQVAPPHFVLYYSLIQHNIKGFHC